jgi:hypothetical protein
VRCNVRSYVVRGLRYVVIGPYFFATLPTIWSRPASIHLAYVSLALRWRQALGNYRYGSAVALQLVE